MALKTAEATPAVVVEPRELTPAEQEQCDVLYDELKPQATQSARDYVLSRTPVSLQEAMSAKIDADWPVPPVMSDEEIASRKLDAESYKRPAPPA